MIHWLVGAVSLWVMAQQPEARAPRAVFETTTVAVSAMSAVPPQGTVHTDTVWAQSLGITKALTVYLPPSYATSPTRRYPVLVYLHGLGGNERNWVDAGHLDRTLDSLVAAGQPEAIVVMPDGDDSWYTTWNQLIDASVCRNDTTRRESASSYCVPWPHYDDYVAVDLVTYVDSVYRTLAQREHRAIAGLSMGGYGAISLALQYPNVFAAAASHSGVLSPRYVGPQPYADPPQYARTMSELQTAAGSLWRSQWPAFGRDTIGWVARDPTQVVKRAMASVPPGALPRLRIDCGLDDRFINQNRDLHQTLLRLGVSHDYAEYPGAHTWSYWSTHATESVVFLLSVVAPSSM